MHRIVILGLILAGFFSILGAFQNPSLEAGEVFRSDLLKARQASIRGDGGLEMDGYFERSLTYLAGRGEETEMKEVLSWWLWYGRPTAAGRGLPKAWLSWVARLEDSASVEFLQRFGPWVWDLHRSSYTDSLHREALALRALLSEAEDLPRAWLSWIALEEARWHLERGDTAALAVCVEGLGAWIGPLWEDYRSKGVVPVALWHELFASYYGLAARWHLVLAADDVAAEAALLHQAQLLRQDRLWDTAAWVRHHASWAALSLHRGDAWEARWHGERINALWPNYSERQGLVLFFRLRLLAGDLPLAREYRLGDLGSEAVDLALEAALLAVRQAKLDEARAWQSWLRAGADLEQDGRFWQLRWVLAAGTRQAMLPKLELWLSEADTLSALRLCLFLADYDSTYRVFFLQRAFDLASGTGGDFFPDLKACPHRLEVLKLHLIALEHWGDSAVLQPRLLAVASDFLDLSWALWPRYQSDAFTLGRMARLWSRLWPRLGGLASASVYDLVLWQEARLALPQLEARRCEDSLYRAFCRSHLALNLRGPSLGDSGLAWLARRDSLARLLKQVYQPLNLPDVQLWSRPTWGQLGGYLGQSQAWAGFWPLLGDEAWGGACFLADTALLWSLDRGLGPKMQQFKTWVEAEAPPLDSFQLLAGDLSKTLLGSWRPEAKLERVWLATAALDLDFPWEALVFPSASDGALAQTWSALPYWIKAQSLPRTWSFLYWWWREQTGKPYGNGQFLALVSGQNTLWQSHLDTLKEDYYGQFIQGTRANEAVFKQWLGEYGFLHLALPYKDTALIFQQNSSVLGEDNYFSMAELKDLSLNAEHLTLAMAWEHGGPSWARVWAEAGVASVLLPRGHRAWSDSSGLILMEDFYQGLTKGWAKDQALRAAQLNLIQSQDNRPPSAWAAWQIWGRVKPFPPQYFFQQIWWYFLPLLSIMALGWWVLRGLKQKR